jgi:hypothetical protein
MKTNIKTRVFIVGCPRSGTTLLQSMLASHSEIHSFPETHFFSYAYPRNVFKRAFTWPALNVRNQLVTFLNEINRADLAKDASVSIFSKNFAAQFIAILDNLSLEAGKSCWVEKTPRHLHCIPMIASQIPSAKFVHIVRNGKDVVASLFEATQGQPEQWAKGRVKGFGGFSIDECINRWNKDITISEDYSNFPDHCVVSYDQLVLNAEHELKSICGFLELPFEASMIQNTKEASNLLLDNETWKANNLQETRKMSSEKFNKLFSPEEKAYIKKNLKRTSLVSA